MSLNKNYIGFDTNKNLREAYNGIMTTYPYSSTVSIDFTDSSTVDYSQYEYDMVFTSPPYYRNNKLIEQYDNMPSYRTRQDFYDKFLIPVIKNTYKHLKDGGVFALNINVGMYDDLLHILGECNEKIPLTLSDRKNNYNEYIYVWKKNTTPS